MDRRLEEMNEVHGWLDIELFIYSKQLLSRTAVLYLHSDTVIRSLTVLRNRLLGELKNRINLVDVHRQLTTRIKKKK